MISSIDSFNFLSTSLSIFLYLESSITLVRIDDLIVLSALSANCSSNSVITFSLYSLAVLKSLLSSALTIASVSLLAQIWLIFTVNTAFFPAKSSV